MADGGHAGAVARFIGGGEAFFIEVNRGGTVVFYAEYDLPSFGLQVDAEESFVLVLFLRYADGVFQKVGQGKGESFLHLRNLFREVHPAGDGNAGVFCLYDVNGNHRIHKGIQAEGVDGGFFQMLVVGAKQLKRFFLVSTADKAVKHIHLVTHVVAEDGELFHAGLNEKHIVLEETDGPLLNFIGALHEHFIFQVLCLQGHIAVQGYEGKKGDKPGQQLVQGPKVLLQTDWHLDKGNEQREKGDVISIGLVIDELAGRAHMAEHMGRKRQGHHKINEVE